MDVTENPENKDISHSLDYNMAELGVCEIVLYSSRSREVKLILYAYFSSIFSRRGRTAYKVVGNACLIHLLEGTYCIRYSSGYALKKSVVNVFLLVRFTEYGKPHTLSGRIHSVPLATILRFFYIMALLTTSVAKQST